MTDTMTVRIVCAVCSKQLYLAEKIPDDKTEIFEAAINTYMGFTDQCGPTHKTQSHLKVYRND